MAIVLVTGSADNALFITSSGSCVLLPQDTFEYEDTILNFYQDDLIANVIQSAITAGRIPDTQSMSAIVDTFYSQYLETYSGDPDPPDFISTLPQDLLDAVNLVANENALPFSQVYRSEVGTNGVAESASIVAGPVGNVTITVTPAGIPEGDEYCRVLLNGEVVIEIVGIPSLPLGFSFFRLYQDTLTVEYLCGGSAGPAEQYTVTISKD